MSALLWAVASGGLKNWTLLIDQLVHLVVCHCVLQKLNKYQSQWACFRQGKVCWGFSSIVRLNCKSKNWSFQTNSLCDSCRGSMVHSCSIFESFPNICRQYLMEFLCETYVKKYTFGGSTQKRNVSEEYFWRQFLLFLLDLTFKSNIIICWCEYLVGKKGAEKYILIPEWGLRVMYVTIVFLISSEKEVRLFHKWVSFLPIFFKLWG